MYLRRRGAAHRRRTDAGRVVHVFVLWIERPAQIAK